MLLLAGCSNKEIPIINNPKNFDEIINNVIIDEEYTVYYKTGYSSSGGDRKYIYYYTVKTEGPISCDGAYYFSGTDGMKKEISCTPEQLINESSRFYHSPTVSELKSKLLATEREGLKITEINERTCFHNMTSDWNKILVCIKDNKIVNYASKGREYVYWNILSYEFTDEMKEWVKTY